MVSVSRETPEQTEQRLRHVLAVAEMVVHEGAWCFRETSLATPPALSLDTLAVVRDEDSWSALVPFTPETQVTPETQDVERFGIFSLHFPAGVDNSGFVGWLATHLKRRLGTGVFVVCGSNRSRGGIYDYWGCPVDLLAEAAAVIEALRLPSDT